jgi:3-hydroxyacyl-CoA dehydrogenase
VIPVRPDLLDRLVRLPPDAPDPASLQIHAPGSPPALRRPTPGVAHLVLGGAEGDLGLALPPQGRLCEVAVPPDEASEASEAAAIALAVAGLRRLGWQPLIVGRRPVLGQRVVAAGQAALDRLRQDGLPEAAIAAALSGFGMAPGGAGQGGAGQGGAGQGALPSPEILARWLAAQANEGLRLLDQGVARRPSDIDLALVLGHGFPRWQGGPMHQADRRGLMALRRDLRAWAAEDPVWSPAPLLDRLIQDGLRLSALDAV